jgi:hypothetical protein
MNAKSNKNRFSVVQLIGDKRIVTFDNLEDALAFASDQVERFGARHDGSVYDRLKKIRHYI